MPVLFIFKAPVSGRLNKNFQLRIFIHQPLALHRTKGNAIVGRILFFSYKCNLKFAHVVKVGKGNRSDTMFTIILNGREK